ncbi:class I SAM-dependent methyltransferase [Chloroflexota bacterium]
MEDKMRRYYDSCAGSFDAGGPTGYFRRVLLSIISPRVPETASILDIGCATGWLLKALDNGKRTLTGVDNSKGMISQTGGIEIIRTDIRDFSSEREFDVVVVSNLLHHFNPQDMKRVLTSAIKALSEGGMILIITPNIYSILVFHYIYRRIASSYGPSVRNILYAQRNIGRVMRKNDLNIGKRLFYAYPLLISLGVRVLEQFEVRRSLPFSGYIIFEGTRKSGTGSR